MISTNPDSDSSESVPNGSSPTAENRRPRRHPLGLGLLVGLVIVIVITVVLAIARHRGAPPRLTETEYQAAVDRWEKSGPADYDLDLEISGNRSGKVHVEVREGEVVHMTRDGVEPNQKRTWDVWSVPGQLETIGQEMEMARHPSESFGTRGAAEVVMWAEFDPRYGYPRRYDRVVLGADIETHWETTRFVVIAPNN